MESDLDSFINSFTFRSKDKKKLEVPQEEPGRNSKELNPHWKNGGTGLPTTNDSNRKSTSSAGDGGLSWWTKALKRCKETADEQGKSLEEVAADRYGSLEFLHKKIKEAELFIASSGRSSSSSSRKGDSHWKGRSFAKPNDSSVYDYYSGRNHRDDERREKKRSYERRDDKRSYERSHGSESIRTETTREASHGKSHRYERDKNSPQQDKIIKQEETQKHIKANELPEESQIEEIMSEVQELSAEERNKLSAKLLRAEMMGDKDLTKKLKSMLDRSAQSNSIKTAAKRTTQDESEEDKEILILRTRSGGAVPFVDRKFADTNNKKQKLDTHRDGERVKYFHDDDHKTLEALVREEKLSRGNDDLNMINRMAGKGLRALNEDETIDDEMLRNEAKNKPSKMLSKEKQLAIIEQKKMSYKINDCAFCIKNIQKHLIVSMGTKALLCLPRNKSMVQGHCLIVALQHVVQSTVCDEDVLEEINMYKRSLVKMFSEDDEDVIFMETCKNLKSYPHLVIECIPVPKETGEMAPIYFQKAINDCGPEWSNNKKLVKIKGGIKRSIPTGFPYFHVGFGMEDGYGHVIEDEESFPWYFGREIIGGLLDLESTLWRKPRFDSFEEQRRKVIEFTTTYKRFDPSVGTQN